MDSENRILSRWIIGFVLFLAFVLLIANKLDAQLPQQQRYMLLYTGASGFNLDCVDQYPYTDTRCTDWNSQDGFTEIEHYDHLLSIIAVSDCNIDNVYTSEHGLFVWRMTDIECNGHRCAVHVNRGYAKVTALLLMVVGAQAYGARLPVERGWQWIGLIT